MLVIGETIHVLDLPNLHQKPPYERILQALQSLELQPTLWNKPARDSPDTLQDRAISRYLTGIISNSFEWFDEEEVDSELKREFLWGLASKRISERCGRSAMGEMTRTWVVPASNNLPELKFALREPPLTGGNLGLKTWGTAYAIVKKLEEFGRHYLSDALQGQPETFPCERETNSTHSLANILELGAGTGLVGIAAAAIWSAQVILTDLKDIQENLEFNIQSNESVVHECGGRTSSAILDWKNPKEYLGGNFCKEFDMIIAADCLYDDEHPELVANMLQRYLARCASSRALVAIPMRDQKTMDLADTLRDILKYNRFTLLYQGQEVCRDDWDAPDEREEVACWWGIFGFGIDSLA